MVTRQGVRLGRVIEGGGGGSVGTVRELAGGRELPRSTPRASQLRVEACAHGKSKEGRVVAANLGGELGDGHGVGGAFYWASEAVGEAAGCNWQRVTTIYANYCKV